MKKGKRLGRPEHCEMPIETSPSLDVKNDRTVGVHSLGKIRGVDLGDVNVDESFMDYLYSLMDKYGFEKDTDLYKKAGITGDKWYKYKNNGTLPQKEVIVSIALAMNLEMNETEGLLTRAGHALRTDSMGDLVVKACIVKRICNVDDINEYLVERGLDTVGLIEK